jgi:protocatechuate 3,4-dioxygenase beta subunit
MKRAYALLATLLLALPTLAATVEGQVYSPDGTAIANATVTAYVPEGSAEQSARFEKRGTRAPLATAKSENGRFSLTSLPDSIVDVDVRADGYAPVVVRTLTGDAPLSITLHPAPLVEGRITARGKPVANAYVVWLGANDVEYTTTTDENGRYRVPDVRRWVREPRVYHPDFAILADSGRGADGLNLDLQPRGAAPQARATGNATVSGTVKLGDKPLAGAPLVIQGSGSQFVAPVRVVTDAKGRYRATGLVPVRTFVAPGEGLEPRIRAGENRMNSEGGLTSVDLSQRAEGTADLTLVRSPMIAGRVTDAEGKPVAGAVVQVVLAGRSTLDFMQDPSARTGADGRYSVAAPPYGSSASVNVAVSAPHRTTIRSKTFTLGNGNQQIDVALPQLQAVTVRVLDRAGQPVPNALVAFASTEETAAFADPRALLAQPFVMRATRATASGEVQLQLAPGTYDFAAEAENFQTAAIADRAVSKAGTIDVTLDQAFALRGRVHRNGTGVANVQVSIIGNEGSYREFGTVTGADGRFEITGLARNKYRLGIFKQDELIQRTMNVDAPGEVDVALPAGGVLRGKVFDAATRQPVREFVFSVEPTGQTDENLRNGTPVLQRGETTADGVFTVTLPTGAYRVQAAANGYTSSEAVEVRLTEGEPADVQLPLERGVSVTGRVTDDGGAPIAGAAVYVTGAELDRISARSSLRGGGPGNARSAEDGTFTIAGLEPGTATLAVRKEGYVPFRQAIDARGTTNVDVRLGRGLTLNGVVLRNGKPVPEVSVGATTAAVGGDHQPTVTDANGRFTLSGLIAARYTVAAYRDDEQTEVRDVDPTQQKELVITLDPRPTGVIFGSVTGIPANAGGKITRRAVFVQSDQRGVEGLIDEAGNYRIENAPAGLVFISAHLESTTGGRSSQRKQVEVTAGQPLRVDLDLGGRTTVTGRVSQDGKPLAGVRVVFVSEAGIDASATSRSDGSFEAGLAAPGTYQIFAHGEAFASRPFQTVREIRGGESIDIDLREQVVEGTIVDASTRQPIAGAIVTLAPDAALIEALAGEAITDASGHYRILTAAAGPHRLIASANGYAQNEQAVTLGGRASQQFSVQLQKVGELRVRAIDAQTGTPLEAHIVVSTLEGDYIPVRAERSADGDWFVFSLSPGRYRVTSVVPGYEQKVIEVTAPGTTEIGM